MSKITRTVAFDRYCAMPGESRSINGLFTALKADGYAVSRKTLDGWAKADGWDAKLERGLAGELQARVEILRKTASSTAEAIDATLQHCALAASELLEAITAKAKDLPMKDWDDAQKAMGLAHKSAQLAVDLQRTVKGVADGVTAGAGETATIQAMQATGSPDALMHAVTLFRQEAPRQ